MFTIAATNLHQIIPSALAIVQREGVLAHSSAGDAYFLPTPMSLIYFQPKQRVHVWKEMPHNPFDHFGVALVCLARKSSDLWDKAGPMGDELALVIETLATNPDRVAAIGTTFFSINAEGAVDHFTSSPSADLVRRSLGFEPVRHSMMQEFVATALGRPVGVSYHTIARPYVLATDSPLFDIPKRGEEDPDDGLTKDPNETDDGEMIPDEYRPQLMSIPRGRWERELSSLVEGGPHQGSCVDPFLEGVARPLLGSWAVFNSPAPDRISEAQAALLGLPARDWAQACWEWLEAQRSPSK